MKKIILFLFVLFAAGLTISCFRPNELGKAVSNKTPEENYQEYCAGCHGVQLQSFVDRNWVYGNSRAEVLKSIKDGRLNDGMVAYDETFTDKELDELTDYIMVGLENLTKNDFEKPADWSGTIESADQNFRLDTILTGLNSPWGLAFLPNGDMLVTDKTGEFYRRTPVGDLHAIEGAPTVNPKGQGGLLDVEVHPDFEQNNWIYLSFSKPVGDKNTTAVLRAELKGNTLVNQQIIFEAFPHLPTRHHYGSRLEFDKEGYLYLSVGDRGRRNDNPQFLNNHCGKIHRIKDDGSIPDDNPFISEHGAVASIYSYGHRNPQGVAMHPLTGKIWTHEHGPRGGDEVNIIQKSKNYGWPTISYGINYNGTIFTEITEKEDMLQPLKYWVPSIAPCGMTFVSSDRYPNWKNDLLVGSLRFKYIARLKMDGDKIVSEEPLLKNIGRIRDIKMSHEGYIYFSVEEPGVVFRMVPVE